MPGNKERLYHIFPAGNGNIVLYITTIVQALQNNFEQVAFVSAASPVKKKYLKRWFHPITDFFRPTKKFLSLLRYSLRYFEFLFALFCIYIYCIFKKPLYINLSTASLLNAEYIFIKAVKRRNIKAIFTVHDAQPFAVGYKRMSEAKQKLFYKAFDQIIVHNENSKDYIKNNFQIADDVFIEFPFPPMDLKEIKNETTLAANKPQRIFLFIGTFKKEKGFDLLFNAWQRIFQSQLNQENSLLVFAGNIPQSIVTPLHNTNDLPANVQVVNKYLTDEEYINFISRADVVILPYIIGTNSAVLSTVASMGKVVIASDIPSLKTNPLMFQEDIFRAGDEQSLANKILEYIEMPQDKLESKKKAQLLKFEELIAGYQRETIDAFKNL